MGNQSIFKALKMKHLDLPERAAFMVQGVLGDTKSLMGIIQLADFINSQAVDQAAPTGPEVPRRWK